MKNRMPPIFFDYYALALLAIRNFGSEAAEMVSRRAESAARMGDRTEARVWLEVLRNVERILSPDRPKGKRPN